jgi:hypothetical protein
MALRPFALSLFIAALCCAQDAAPITPAERTELFNGKDLSGWVSYLKDGSEAAKVWSVQDGILRCVGEPWGYLRTAKTWRDFRLTVEWRFTKSGNTGVFVHVNGEDKIWPCLFEAQGMHGQQGAVVFLGGSKAAEKPAKGALKRTVEDAEKPLGEWNTYEVVCKGDTVTISLNGKEMNRISGCEPSSGAVALQSEGGAWEARKVVIEPLR